MLKKRRSPNTVTDDIMMNFEYNRQKVMNLPKSYSVVIQKEDTGYIVTCRIFEGCYSQGDKFEEALENIREAIALCIEDNIEENDNQTIIVAQVVV